MSQHNIPSTQTAAVIKEKGASLQVVHDFPVRKVEDLKPGECLVKIEASGVCHTDLHAAKDDWPLHPTYPLVGGHEGVGQIIAIAPNTPQDTCPVKVGDRVGIKWLADSCLNCEFCKKGMEQNCVGAKLSGFSVDGTFSEYVVSYVNHVSKIPEGLGSQEAASICCAGVTVYRAIKYSQTQVGDWIVLPGAGGGLGHLAIQYAKAKGLKVLAIDTGSDKKTLCEKLGADAWIDFKESKDIVKDVQAICDGLGPHSAVVTSAHPSGYTQAVDYLRPGGTLMAVGLPGDAKLEASIFFTVLKSIKIIGSYVGSRTDADEALKIAADGKIKVNFVCRGLKDLKHVYEEMEQGKIAGRIVLDYSKK